MAHNHASWRVHYALAHFPTLYGARWRRSAIDCVRWRSTAFNGGLIQFSYKKKRIKQVCSQFILVLDSIAMAFMLPGDRLRVLQAWLQLNRVNRDRDIDVVQYLMFAEARRPRRRRRFWVRPWLERPPLHGQYERLMVEMTQEDPASFRNFLRMEPAMFRELLVRIGPRLQRKTTFWRQPLDAGLKLAITLRHLATGDSYMSLMYSFRVHSSTISLFVPEVCDAITELLEDEVITKPTTPDQWLEVAELLGTRWQVHHAPGALDGKHVRIRQPRRGGSLYFNYKHFHSIILLALADADYRFIWVDVGANGSASDCQVFNESDLKDCIHSRIIGFPAPSHLPNDNKNTPYFILGDDAFALRTWMMKPFPARNLTHDERIYNYRISRGRRVVENAFGILGNRFQCLLGTMQREPDNVVSLVMACICLHNLMRMRYPAAQNAALDMEGQNGQVIPGAWREGRNMLDLDIVTGGNRDTRAAKKQRLYLKHYFNSPAGSIPWQEDCIWEGQWLTFCSWI